MSIHKVNRSIDRRHLVLRMDTELVASGSWRILLLRHEIHVLRIIKLCRDFRLDSPMPDYWIVQRVWHY